MIQPRPLVPGRDTCGRATPSRIIHRVAGMAFNFSTTELPGRILKPEAATHREAHRITLRTRRAPRDLGNQQHAVMS